MEELTTPDSAAGELYHTFPCALPGSKAVLFNAATGVTVDQARIVALNLETGEQETLLERAGRPRYAPTGHLLFTHQGKIRVAPFDTETVKITGAIVPLAERGLIDEETEYTHYSFSDDGLLVFVPLGSELISKASWTLVWVDRDGTEEILPVPPGLYRYPRIAYTLESCLELLKHRPASVYEKCSIRTSGHRNNPFGRRQGQLI